MTAPIEVQLTLGASGCSHASARHLGFRRYHEKTIEFPAGWALIEHPLAGAILFDTGYGAAARTAMRGGLRKLYQRVIRAESPPAQDAMRFLAERGVAAESVRTIIISHFHPDHIGGLDDFPNASLICAEEAWRAASSGTGWQRLRGQIWRETLPGDAARRIVPLGSTARKKLDESHFPFTDGWDLLGDGSLSIIPLPGHSEGQIGLSLRSSGTRVLLAADAIWRIEQLAEARVLPALTRFFAVHDASLYLETLDRLIQFQGAHPEAWIIPSHCASTAEAWRRRTPG